MRQAWVLFFLLGVVVKAEALYNHNPFKDKPVVINNIIVPSDKENRPLGAFLGLAMGDMLGSPLELLERDAYSFDHPHQPYFREALWPSGLLKIFLDPYKARHFNSLGWQPGEWSDNTSIALCLAASLVEKGFNLRDQMDRWVRWRQSGYMSFRKTSPTLGLSLSRVLEVYQKQAFEKDFDLTTLGTHNKHTFTQKLSEGNSAMARTIPLVLWASSLEELKDSVLKNAQLTHGAPKALQSSLVVALILWKGLQSTADKSLKIKNDMLSLTPQELSSMGITDEKVREVALGLGNRRWKEKSFSHMKATGFALDTLECALWAFYHSKDPETGLKNVILLGGDTSTIATLAGQLLGMCYGLTAFPLSWQQYLWGYDIIFKMGQALIQSRNKNLS